MDQGVRDGDHGACRRASGDRHHHRGHAVGNRDGHLQKEVAGAGLRRRDRRGARDDLRRRAPYRAWELLRAGKECAILAVGVMCQPALEAAHLLVADGFDVTVVNCRFIKPLDRRMLEGLLRDHKILVTVEDATRVNGFGAYLAATVEGLAPEARVVVMGADERTYEHASRGAQLAEVGLTGKGIAERVRVAAAEESPVAP